MIEKALIDYGGLGIFIIYLIYDRQVLSKKLISALNKLTEAVTSCPKKR